MKAELRWKMANKKTLDRMYRMFMIKKELDGITG
jgi:hypothetical protein